MHSRLFVRVGGRVHPGQIQAGEQAPAPAFCQHQIAGSGDRSQICPECGLPVPCVPPASA